MTVLTFPPRRNAPQQHLVVAFVDLQREYATEGRSFAIQHLEACLAACTALLAFARHQRWAIVHFRQLCSEPCFNRMSPFSDWIDGFRPRASEAVFERALPSIYSNADFGAYVAGVSDPTILLAGLPADRACLASAVEAHHRNHRLLFVEDCSACGPIADLPEERSHALVTDVIGRFVEVTRSADVIDWFDGSRGSARKNVQ